MKRFIIVAALLPLSAMAQPVVDEVNYHYLEMGLLATERDFPGGDIDGRGRARLNYSFPIRDHIHLFAGIEGVTYKDVPPDTSGKSRAKEIGIGTHFNFGRRLSVYGRFAYTDLDLTLGPVSTSDDGASVTAGVRFIPAAGYEIRGHARYRNLDNASSDTTFGVGGDIYMTDVVALTLDLSVGDDENAILVGARFYFGQDRRAARPR
jgi:hypothetical protein